MKRYRNWLIIVWMLITLVGTAINVWFGLGSAFGVIVWDRVTIKQHNRLEK